MRGWAGGSDGTKVMMMEMDMPHCKDKSCGWNRPAVWALNARVGGLSYAARRVVDVGRGATDCVEVAEIVLAFSLLSLSLGSPSGTASIPYVNLYRAGKLTPLIAGIRLLQHRKCSNASVFSPFRGYFDVRKKSYEAPYLNHFEIYRSCLGFDDDTLGAVQRSRPSIGFSEKFTCI